MSSPQPAQPGQLPLVPLFFHLLPIPAHSAHVIALPASYSSPRPHHVSAQVDAEDGHGAQGQGNVDNDEKQEGCNLRDVAGQSVGDGFLQVVKDKAAWVEVLKASGRSEGTFPTPSPGSVAAQLPERGRFCV